MLSLKILSIVCHVKGATENLAFAQGGDLRCKRMASNVSSRTYCGLRTLLLAVLRFDFLVLEWH